LAKRKATAALGGTATRRRRALATPEETARAATARVASETPSADKVRLTLSVYLSREQAERLTARAIREGKNLEALVAEVLEDTPAE
jgi:hypothetical protein